MKILFAALALLAFKGDTTYNGDKVDETIRPKTGKVIVPGAPDLLTMCVGKVRVLMTAEYGGKITNLIGVADSTCTSD